jgi:hypothetical protein
MHISAVVAALVIGGVFLALVVGVLLPFLFVGGLVWAVVRTVGALRGRRDPGAPAAVGAYAAADADRDIGWAVGLLVAGVLWCLGRYHFAALLLGAGAAILTRGLLGMRRESAPRI